ncbi:MAG: pyrimidine 5'-nucleotidase [Burkholderiales bacterium]|nr:pyrimidine 5'-nucleotidase [Burkholderiales bacterium]
MPPASKLTWLFDLDNTLHNASYAIFPAINANMNAYMARVLGDGDTPADTDHVNAMRLLYWRRYGATLLGMMKHHQVKMHDFLREAHRFDNLTDIIRAERGLGHLLARLPGKKILLTNAPHGYSHEVIRHVGLHRHFAEHIAIEAMHVHGRLCPKPSRILLRKILARHRIVPERSILVEDSLDALKAAKSLGMRTVWVTQYMPTNPDLQARCGHPASPVVTKFPVCVDVKVKSVRDLPGSLAKLGCLFAKSV